MSRREMVDDMPAEHPTDGRLSEYPMDMPSEYPTDGRLSEYPMDDMPSECPPDEAVNKTSDVANPVLGSSTAPTASRQKSPVVISLLNSNDSSSDQPDDGHRLGHSSSSVSTSGTTLNSVASQARSETHPAPTDISKAAEKTISEPVSAPIPAKSPTTSENTTSPAGPTSSAHSKNNEMNKTRAEHPSTSKGKPTTVPRKPSAKELLRFPNMSVSGCEDPSPSTLKVPTEKDRQRAKAQAKKQIRNSFLPSLPFKQFMAQVSEECQQKDPTRNTGYAVAPWDRTSRRVHACRQRVKKLWIRQGIWDESWYNAPSGLWKHETAQHYIGPGSEEEARLYPFQEATREQLPKDRKRRREEAEALDRSRPFGQFMFQLAMERTRLLQQFEKEAKDNEKELKESVEVSFADASTSAYFIVKNAWEKRGIWEKKWGNLPGMAWKHEQSFERFLQAAMGQEKYALLAHDDLLQYVQPFLDGAGVVSANKRRLLDTTLKHASVVESQSSSAESLSSSLNSFSSPAHSSIDLSPTPPTRRMLAEAAACTSNVNAGTHGGVTTSPLPSPLLQQAVQDRRRRGETDSGNESDSSVRSGHSGHSDLSGLSDAAASFNSSDCSVVDRLPGENSTLESEMTQTETAPQDKHVNILPDDFEDELRILKSRATAVRQKWQKERAKARQAARAATKSQGGEDETKKDGISNRYAEKMVRHLRRKHPRG